MQAPHENLRTGTKGHSYMVDLRAASNCVQACGCNDRVLSTAFLSDAA